MSFNKAFGAFNEATIAFDAGNNITINTDEFSYQTVEQFGHKFVVPREKFLEATFQFVVATIHEFVLALLESAMAGFKGEFQDSNLNDRCVQAWKNTGRSLEFFLFTAIGTISPTACKFTFEKTFEFEEWISEKLSN